MRYQYILMFGVIFDFIGGVLIANEVFRVFSGPTTIGIGHSGCVNGSFIPKANPQFEQHEKRKRLVIAWGLVLLLIGFILAMIGTWLSFTG